MLSTALAVVAVALGMVAPSLAPAATWPLHPRPPVVRGFDPPTSSWGAGHRGVDLLGRSGEEVHAAAAGTITFAGVLAGRGVVVIDHGTLRTTYEPVAAAVHVGDPVAEGQMIGTLQVGLSHCFPRACLHWGLLRGSDYLDPLTLVGAGPIRLLPLSGGPPLSSAPVALPGLTPGGGRAGRPVAAVRW